MEDEQRAFTVVGLVGSLRRASLNQGLMLAAQEVAPEGMTIQIADIGVLPHYNADLDGMAAPPSVAHFCNMIRKADAVLIATPEYNHSMPGFLKNALDWAGSSRSKPSVPLQGKAVATMGASPGKSGAIRAQLALKITLTSCKAQVLGGVDTYFQNAATLFNSEGRLIDENARKSVHNILVELQAWASVVAAMPK